MQKLCRRRCKREYSGPGKQKYCKFVCKKLCGKRRRQVSSPFRIHPLHVCWYQFALCWGFKCFRGMLKCFRGVLKYFPVMLKCFRGVLKCFRGVLKSFRGVLKCLCQVFNCLCSKPKCLLWLLKYWRKVLKCCLEYSILLFFYLLLTFDLKELSLNLDESYCPLSQMHACSMRRQPLGYQVLYLMMPSVLFLELKTVSKNPNSSPLRGKNLIHVWNLPPW